jgi:methyltransferase-like protein
MLLSRELELLRDKQGYYLFHEYLEDVNEPLYFNQFAERAIRHGLQYLGEAEFSSMSASNFPPHVERMLHEVSDDTVRMEQYMDFVRNRMFRQTLLCHQDVTLERTVPPERIYEMFIASNARPSAEIDVRSREPATFQRPGSTMTTSEPLVKAAMLHLAEQRPRPVYFRELVNTARRCLSPGPLILDAERVRREAEVIARPLLNCYATTHVDLSTHAVALAIEPPTFPWTPRLARFQAVSSNRVTNLWHRSVTVSDLQRHLLQWLDGNHDRAALVEQLNRRVNDGSLIVHEQGTAVSDSQRVRELLNDILENNLVQLGAKGLLQIQTDG